MTETVQTQFVLCPGFMNDRALWDRVAPVLRGLGEIHHADTAKDDTLKGMAARTLAAAPDRFVLVGFSMGGYVAQEIIAQAPGRVRALVLMNTSARPNRPDMLKRNRNLIALTKSQGFRGLFKPAVIKALHPDRRGDEALIGDILAMGARLGEKAFLNQLALVREDRRPALKNIKCPALIIWSRQDELRSLEESEELATGIPDTRLKIIENCGHMTPLEAPEAVSELICRFGAEAPD